MTLFEDDDIKRELEITKQDIENQKIKTKLAKVRFINELKNGLGQEIKKNPNLVIIKKKTFLQRLKIFIRNIFLKF